MSQFCISCGVENPDEAKFCKSCGEKLKTDEAERAEQEERVKEAQQKKEEKEAAEKAKYESIGGWLAFFGFILVVGNISWLAYIVKTYGGDEFTTTIESLYMQGYTETVSYLNMLVAVELVEYFFVLLLTINFFMKSPITRVLMIIYSIVMITGVPISIALLYKINPDMSQYTSEIGKMIGSTFWVIVWLFYFIFSKRVKKTFVSKDGNEPENSLVVTIIFALLIPGYFGYKHYATVSSLKSISNDSYALTQKAIAFQDKKDYSSAIPYLSKAADLGSPRAMGLLCFSYIDGTGVDKNLYTAKQWCEDAYTSTNESDIQKLMAEEIGNIYFLQNNFKDAKVWYTKAMNTFSTKAEKAKFSHKIAEKYFDAKHYTTSAYWYKIAVDNGDKDAMFRLAYSYGARKNYTAAIKWYKKSQEYSSWNGTMYNLGNAYSSNKQYKNAIYWYKKAIKSGYKDAYFSLAYAYDILGNTKNAIKWYKKSANTNGEVVAMYNLGILYNNQRDYSKAKYWYEKASKKGYASAIGNLAVMYDNGDGVVEDNYKAFNLYLRAAKLGNKIAMNNLATMYETGSGTYQDYYQAQVWRQKAAR